MSDDVGKPDTPAGRAAAQAAKGFLGRTQQQRPAAPAAAGQPDSQVDDAGVLYEVAIEILARLGGYAATRIDAEKAKESPHLPTIEAWQQRRRAWLERELSLDPGDHAAVQTVLDEDSAYLRSLPPHNLPPRR